MMFGEALKQAMQEKGISQSELSAATGICKSGISQYLAGKNEPSKARKKLLAVALGLPTDYFDNTEVEAPNLPIMTAAKLMGKSKEFIYQGLREGVFPWGYAVKMGSNWSYYISPVMFSKCTGLVIE